jgi:predicted O-methyltransferase YrrM
MKRVIADPLKAVDDEGCLGALVYGWGNEGWSAEHEYLRHMVRVVHRLGSQPVLECGSGLSTLLLAATAASQGGHVTSLEHVPRWADRVRKELKRYGLLENATPRVAPLRSYGAFTWYDAPDVVGPFAAVVCDGPPSATPGGRYGLMPVMGGQLRSGCQILLDDAARSEEQEILRQWQKESGATYRVFGGEKPFAEMTLP